MSIHPICHLLVVSGIPCLTSPFPIYKALRAVVGMPFFDLFETKGMRKNYQST
jgi:hypothetical protein